MDEDLIIEIWDLFKEYISDKNKEVAANQFVDMLVDKDVDVKTLKGLLGYDSYLDDAINLSINQDDEEKEDDEDDWGEEFYEDSDEDM
jgi:hypothetical protein